VPQTPNWTEHCTAGRIASPQSTGSVFYTDATGTRVSSPTSAARQVDRVIRLGVGRTQIRSVAQTARLGV